MKFAGGMARWLRIAVAGVVVLMVAGSVAACGSSSSKSGHSAAQTEGSSGSSSGGEEQGSESNLVSSAKTEVTKWQAPMREFVGPSSSPGPIPHGKHLVAITCSPSPFCTISAEGTAAAAKLVGWSTQIVQTEGTPQSWVNAINTAIAGHASAIVLNAASAKAIPQAVAAAQAKGIPVVGTGQCDKPVPGIINNVDIVGFGRQAGHALGEWVIAHAPKGAQILLVSLAGFSCLEIPVEGFKEALKSAGPNYEIVEEQQSPLSDVGTPAGVEKFASMMRSHPEAKFMYILSESWASDFVQALHSLGRTDVTGVGVNGEDFIPQIRKGAPVVLAGMDTLQYGYGVVDSLIRYWNKKPQVSYEFPFQMVGPENASSVKGKSIEADYSLAESWSKLWGVTK